MLIQVSSLPFRILVLPFAMPLLMGCASPHMNANATSNPKVEAVEPEVQASQTEGDPALSPHDRIPGHSAATVASRGTMKIAALESLSTEQRQKVHEIYSRTAQKAAMIRTAIADAKSEIFSLLAKKRYNSPEIERLKQRIVDLDKKRLDTMFAALADLQGIIGQGVEKEEIYKHLRDYDHRNLNQSTALRE